MMGLASVALASLVGSVHCVGMCGGLVGFYAGNAETPRRRWAAHAAYHGTRLVAYTALGALAGQLGAGLDLAGRAAGVGGLGAVLAGVVMLLWAALMWPRHRAPLVQLRARHGRATLWSKVEARFVALARSARQKPPVTRAALLGLSSALLPCGWLYAFVVLAAGAGSAAAGGMLLAAFWSGTLPALLGLGLGVQHLAARFRGHVPRLSAALLLVLGSITLVQRWSLAVPPSPTGPASNAAPVPACHAQH